MNGETRIMTVRNNLQPNKPWLFTLKDKNDSVCRSRTSLARLLVLALVTENDESFAHNEVSSISL